MFIKKQNKKPNKQKSQRSTRKQSHLRTTHPTGTNMIKKNHLKKRNQFPRGGRHLLNTHCALGLILEDMIKKMQALLLQGSEQQNEARDLTYRKMASQTQGHENLMFCTQQYLQDESGWKRYPEGNLDQVLCWSMRCRPNQREETTKCKDYSEHIKTVDIIGEAGEL